MLYFLNYRLSMCVFMCEIPMYRVGGSKIPLLWVIWPVPLVSVYSDSLIQCSSVHKMHGIHHSSVVSICKLLGHTVKPF